MNCDAVITGNSVEEGAQKALVRAQGKDADVLNTMTPPQQLAQRQQLQGAIKAV